MAVMFGLGWGFGLLATSYPVEEVTITFQVLFSIFVGAQGALLFLLHGMRNADARRVWSSSVSSIMTRLRSIVSSSFNRSVTVTQNSAKASQNSTSLKLTQLHELSHSDPQVLASGISPGYKVLATCTSPEIR